MKKTIILPFLFFTTFLFSQTDTLNQIDAKGLKQGMWKKNYANGKIMFEANFKDNVPIGEMKRYHRSGKLKETCYK